MLVLAEIFNDFATNLKEPMASKVGGLGRNLCRVLEFCDREGFRVDENHLAKNAEAGVRAALFSEVLDLRLNIRRLFPSPSFEVVTHLVGKGDKVEFAGRERLLRNGARVLTVVIEFFWGEGDGLTV